MFCAFLSLAVYCLFWVDSFFESSCAHAPHVSDVYVLKSKCAQNQQTYPFTGRVQIRSQYVSNNNVTCVFGLNKPVANVSPNIATFKSSTIKCQKKFLFSHFSFFPMFRYHDLVCLCAHVWALFVSIFSHAAIALRCFLLRRLLACWYSADTELHTRAHSPCKCVILFRISRPRNNERITRKQIYAIGHSIALPFALNTFWCSLIAPLYPIPCAAQSLAFVANPSCVCAPACVMF